jgi:hypothetical protein
VFGPDAKKRIWLMLDGDELYVDRNGDGDLTGKEKKAEELPIPKPNKIQQVTSFLRHIPTPQGKITVEVTRTLYDRIRNNHCVSVWLGMRQRSRAVFSGRVAPKSLCGCSALLSSWDCSFRRHRFSSTLEQLRKEIEMREMNDSGSGLGRSTGG